jgi:hypothetical protein
LLIVRFSFIFSKNRSIFSNYFFFSHLVWYWYSTFSFIFFNLNLLLDFSSTRLFFNFRF